MHRVARKGRQHGACLQTLVHFICPLWLYSRSRSSYSSCWLTPWCWLDTIWFFNKGLVVLNFCYTSSWFVTWFAFQRFNSKHNPASEPRGIMGKQNTNCDRDHIKWIKFLHVYFNIVFHVICCWTGEKNRLDLICWLIFWQ